jgi:GNAT superfamily N-acetyltransferase
LHTVLEELMNTEELNFQIIRLNRSHLTEILELYSELQPTDPILSKDQANRIWDQISQKDNFRYYGLAVNSPEKSSILISSCTISIIPNLTRGGRPYGLIENVITRNEFRNTGYGTKLLQNVLDIAWKEKCYKVMLLTGSKKESVHNFYKKNRFLPELKTGYIAYPPK